MIETEKRGRSIVLAGVDEAPSDLTPYMRLKDLKSKVENVMSALRVDCRPSEVYRMGKIDPNRPRLMSTSGSELNESEGSFDSNLNLINIAFRIDGPHEILRDLRRDIRQIKDALQTITNEFERCLEHNNN
ncbi:hypothetical protein ANCDUO_04283 [Ancylostoma duodenale]|uniref:Uncharacterized protein n=1 Tax=Ancylostoma duodenale TaxID=51022 RepID=A0A0C2H7K1_9BILA|nr:hypothetical protein ANCDUO_04283 [Ancylostoma duodenale]